jgi:hypothetical protein
VLVAVSLLLVGSASKAAKPATVTIVAVGDMAMVRSPDGGASFFSRHVRRKLAGDVVLGNLEGTLTTVGSSKCGPASTDCFAFRAPPSYARLLERAGFTIVSVANNHAYDYGRAGQAQTLAALGAANLRWTGRPGQITILHAGGLRVAVLGFAPYAWAQSLTDVPAATRLVRRASRKADLVVVAMHAGAEGADHQHVPKGSETFLGENRGDPRVFSHAVVNAGADLVVGSGPHVLRGMEWYHGRLIAYSMGNFLGDGTLVIDGVLGVSGILRVILRADGSLARADLVAIRLVRSGVPVLDDAGTAYGHVRLLSRDDFGRGAVRVAQGGALSPPTVHKRSRER